MTQQPSVRSANEIELAGKRFRTIGGVSSTMLSQWAPKVTQGDTDRDSDPIRSTLGLSDFRGGIGLDLYEGSGDTDRLYWSTHDLRYAGHLLHLPASIGQASTRFTNQRTIPKPAEAALTAISFIQTFANELYVGFGTKVYKWNDTNTSWPAAAEHTLPGIATDTLVTRLGDTRQQYLIIACGDAGYAYYDGTDWVDVTSQKATFLVWWDYRVWALADDGQMSYTADLAGTWTDEAWLPLPNDFASAMFVAKGGELNLPIIHVVAQNGTMWQHNTTNTRFVDAGIALPFHPNTGLGASVWRDSIYIPSGLALSQIDNRAVVAEVGLDRDAGIPQERSGRIIQIIPAPRTLIALVEGESESTAQDFLTPGPLDSYLPLIYSATRKPSTIFERVGSGWQVLWSGGQDGETPTVADQLLTGHLSSAYGEYRLWWGAGTQLWYIDFPVHVINPRNLPDRPYVYYGESFTPWFNAQQAEARKVAVDFLAETRNLSEGEAHVEIDAGFDYDESDTAWQPIVLQNPDYDPTDPDSEEFLVLDLEDSTLQEPFYVQSPIASIEDHNPRKGASFRAIRFRLRSYLGSNQLLSPDINSLTLEYFKRRGIIQKYSFSVTIDLSQEYNRRSAIQLAQELREIADAAEMVPFTYKERDQQPRTFYVKITQDRRYEPTGPQMVNSRSTLELLEI